MQQGFWLINHLTCLERFGSFFVGPLIPLFSTSCDVCPWFQTFVCMLHRLHAMDFPLLVCLALSVILSFTSGATPTDLYMARITAESFRSSYFFKHWRDSNPSHMPVTPWQFDDHWLDVFKWSFMEYSDVISQYQITRYISSVTFLFTPSVEHLSK